MFKYLLLFLIPILSFGMSAKEANRIASSNKDRLADKCVKNMIKELDRFITDVSNEGGFATCDELFGKDLSNCYYMKEEVYHRVLDHFSSLGYKTYDNNDACVDWNNSK